MIQIDKTDYLRQNSSPATKSAKSKKLQSFFSWIAWTDCTSLLQSEDSDETMKLIEFAERAAEVEAARPTLIIHVSSPSAPSSKE